MRLAEIVGQPGAVALLARLVAARRLPHALLLEGPPGCGRRTLARALAQALLCAQPVGGDACGACAACRMAMEGSHPDLVESGHDSDGGTLDTEAVRETVTARAYESPLAGERRAFALYGVERLHPSAANAMLKALEEPPPGAYFLMTTAQSAGVLKTIRSRAQLVRLQPLSEADVAAVLVRGGVPASEARQRAMRGAGGHRGLWGELESLPLDALRSLCVDGLRSETVAEVVGALPTRLSAAQEEAGRTLLQEQRRALRQWLAALAHDLGQSLRREPDPVTAARIDRVLAANRDLDHNLAPRLVIEALALEARR